MDPLATITASAIAQLAFNEFVKSGAGELARKSVQSATALIDRLRQKIHARLSGNPQAEAALTEVKAQGTQEALDQITKQLDIEMTKDAAFASEIQQLAQRIYAVRYQRTYENYGRDQINIERIDGNPKIGGS